MNVYYLVVLFIGGGFSMTPFPTEKACLKAEAMLAMEVVQESTCQHAWLEWHEYDHPAPEFSPLPVPRGRR